MLRQLFEPHKVNRNTIVTYNDENILKWEKEFIENNRKLSENSATIRRLQNEITNIDTSLDLLNQKLTELDKFGQHHSETLKRERDQAISGKSDLISQRSLKQDKLSDLIRENKKLKEDQAFIERELPQARTFMEQLRQDSQLLCESFSKIILAGIYAYEADYPVDQKFEVRACLHNIKSKINHILTGDMKQEGNADWPIKYAQLCGFLWEMLDQVDGKDSTFSKTIMSILEKSYIAADTGLPNECYTNQSVRGEFANFKDKNKETYPTLTEKELEKAEDKEYYAAYKDLQTTLGEVRTEHPNLYKQGKKVLDGMHESIGARTQGCRLKRGDIKLHTTILTQTKEKILGIARGNINPHVSRRFDKLVDKVDGHPSLSKKIVGGLLGLTSAALFAISVTACAATFGASTPLSALGIVLSGIILTKALTLTAAVVTAAVTVASVGLFADGVRHGMSKNLDNINNASNQLEMEEMDSRPVFVT